MKDDYCIHLNFLPVSGPLPSFRIYRMLRIDSEPRPDELSVSFSFAKDGDPDERVFYWVRPTAADGFVQYTANPDENSGLTRWALSRALRDSVCRGLERDKYIFDDRGFIDEIALIMRQHLEGQEVLVIQPYHLREAQQFGCLVDFHFRLKAGVSFSRRVQQLSLSLDRNFKRNLDCYIDRIEKIQTFLRERAVVLSRLLLPGADATVNLSADFVPLPARRLRTKTYIGSSVIKCAVLGFWGFPFGWAAVG
jgi:hypothetical protein